MIDHPRISIKTCENEQLIFEALALLRQRVVKRTSKVIITNFFMLDPIKSRRRYFFTLVAYEFSFFSFLSCCLSCVCFWHLFWQFSLGEKGLSAWEISISTKSCQTWAKTWMLRSTPLFFCKIRISVWWVFTYASASGLEGISRSKLCFCTGEIACYSTFDGEKMRKLLFALYFFPVKKGKGRKNLWLKLSNTT